MALLEDMEFPSSDVAQVRYMREGPPGTLVFPFQYRNSNRQPAYNGPMVFSVSPTEWWKLYSSDPNISDLYSFCTFPKDMLDQAGGMTAFLIWKRVTDRSGGMTSVIALQEGTVSRFNDDQFQEGTEFMLTNGTPIQFVAVDAGTTTGGATRTVPLEIGSVVGSYCSILYYLRDHWSGYSGSTSLFTLELRDSDGETVYSAGEGLHGPNCAFNDLGGLGGTVGMLWPAATGTRLGTAIQPYRETGTKTEGDSSLGVIYTTNAAGTKLIRTFATAVDMRGADYVTFDVQSDRAGTNFDILLIDSDGGTHSVTPNLGAAGSWYTGSISLT